MQRIVTSTDLGEGRTRIRVRIESDECETGSSMEEPIKQVLMQNFADNPMLLMCGTTPFQFLRMTHNHVRWIVEAEAVVESTDAKQLRGSA